MTCRTLGGWAWFAVLAITACSSSDPDPEPRPYIPPSEPLVEEYRLGVGDVFDVVVYGEPSLSHTIVVRPDGFISMPLAEEIHVVGKTIHELDTEITDRMAHSLVEPQVSIIMKDFAAQSVFVGGEVGRTGELPLEGRMSVLQALVRAGGPLVTADTESVVVLRNTQTGPEAFELSLDERMEGEAQSPFWLHPYDVVIVPRTTIANWNIWVDQYVRKLLPISLHSGFNWVYSLSDSGGTITVNQ